MDVLNPQIEKIQKGTPMCKFPRESYNRIAEILGHLKARHGVRMERGGPGGDYWTIELDELWLYAFVMMYVLPLLDLVSNESEMNGISDDKTVVTDIAWDETNHKFTKTVETWKLVGGRVAEVSDPETSDIVTLVQEMP